MSKAKYYTLKVEITKGDYRRGIRSNTTQCAFARAIRRALKAAKLPYIFEGVEDDCDDSLAADAVFRHKLTTFTDYVRLPAKAGKAIAAYDGGATLAKCPPMTFTLRILR